ncbi:MAG: helix-turn-helix transcriptional regulator [Solobacterium sp.]|nr:helix-turn-helix transcriptional regulator [Solobacterium sp.]
MAMKKKSVSFDIERLEYAMKAKKITIQTLCKSCKFSYESYKKYRQHGEINPDKLRLIAENLNVSYDWLRGHEVHMSKDIPFGEDYIQNVDGFVIPKYISQTMDDIQEYLHTCDELFDAWFDKQNWHYWVNKKLSEQKEMPIQKKELKGFLELYQITYESQAFEYVLDCIVRDILRKRINKK